MRKIFAEYSILKVLEVPDDATDEEINEIVEAYAKDEGFYDLVNDIEWSED